MINLYVYTPGISGLNQKLSDITGLVFSTEPTPDSPPAVTLVIRKNAMGGVDNPTPYISDPMRTIVIPGLDNDQGFAFADTAVASGVPGENLFFVPTGQRLNLQQVAQKIIQVINEFPVPAKPSPLTFDNNKRVKVIALIGCRGGVGRTTLGTSLAGHYKDINQTVAYLDLGSPAASYKHTGVTLQEQEGYRFAQSPYCDIYAPSGPVWEFSPEDTKELINVLRAKYRRVIVDFSAELSNKQFEAVNPDKVLAIMDADVTQTVEPLANLQGQAVFIYNKAVPEVDISVIKAFVGDNVLVIGNDIDGCQVAALNTGEPAYRTSEVMARAIGEIAYEIDT